MIRTPQNYKSYARFFSRTSFWRKLSHVAAQAGRKVVYAALVLYYAATSKSVPLKDRAKIYGALGYFILPVDLIPDFTGLLGYTDDLTALVWALRTVANNITPDVCEKAAQKLFTWFPIASSTSDMEEISTLNQQLGLPVPTEVRTKKSDKSDNSDLPDYS